MAKSGAPASGSVLDRPAMQLARPKVILKDILGRSYIDSVYSSLRSDEPRFIRIPYEVNMRGFRGTLTGSSEYEWTALNDFWETLYPTMDRVATRKGLNTDHTDVAAGVELDYYDKLMKAASIGLPLLAWYNGQGKAISVKNSVQYIYQRRGRLFDMVGRLGEYPCAPFLRSLMQYWSGIVCLDPSNGPFFQLFGRGSATVNAELDFDSTADVDAQLDDLDTALDVIDASADYRKFRLIQDILHPEWTATWSVPEPRVDPGYLSLLRQCALRRNDPTALARTAQFPARTVDGVAFSNKLLVYSTPGLPEIYTVSCFRPAFLYEDDTRSDSELTYGFFGLHGPADDEESILVQYADNGTPTIEEFDYDLADTLINTKVFPQFINAGPCLQDSGVLLNLTAFPWEAADPVLIPYENFAQAGLAILHKEFQVGPNETVGLP